MTEPHVAAVLLLVDKQRREEDNVSDKNDSTPTKGAFSRRQGRRQGESSEDQVCLALFPSLPDGRDALGSKRESLPGRRTAVLNCVGVDRIPLPLAPRPSKLGANAKPRRQTVLILMTKTTMVMTLRIPPLRPSDNRRLPKQLQVRLSSAFWKSRSSQRLRSSN